MILPARLPTALAAILLGTVLTGTSWASGAWQVSVATDRDTYLYREPIQVRLEVGHTGSDSRQVRLDRFPFAIDVLDADDHRIAYFARHLSPPVSGSPVELRTGEVASLLETHWAQGRGHFPRSAAPPRDLQVEPGTYRLRVWIAGVETGEPMTLESAPFRIVEEPFQPHVPVLSGFGRGVLAALMVLACGVLRPIVGSPA